jgi:microcystin-dependent protein
MEYCSVTRPPARWHLAEPYLGEIRMVGFNFAAQGWATANGQTLPVSQNTALFALLGTTFGGNGTTTFQLPNVQSRMPMSMGTGVNLASRPLGQMAGTENAAFASAQIPSAPVAPIQALSSPLSPTSSVSPFLVVNFLIALQGIFPSRN